MGNKVDKKITITLLIFHSLNYLSLAKPIYEKLWIGMPINSFNALNLGEFVYSQNRKTALTSYGLVYLDSLSVRRYFQMNDQIWKGVLVEIQNDKIQEFTLQGGAKVSKAQLQEIFSDLLRIHGVKFNLKNYRSLSRKGYSVIWRQQGQLVSMNLTIDKNNEYTISLKKTHSDDGPKQQHFQENAILALEPILGKGFHKLDPSQIADRRADQTLDDLLAN